MLYCSTSHGLHDAVVKAYRAFGRAVWKDLRCLGIIILQIYTLSVFRQEEVDSLMHWPVSTRCNVVVAL